MSSPSNVAETPITDRRALVEYLAACARPIGAWKIGGFARLDNITGTRYAGSVIVNETNGRFYEPSPGRNYMVGVNASYTF